MLSFVAAPSIKRKLIILHFLPQGSVQSSVKYTAQHKLPNAMKVLGNTVQKSNGCQPEDGVLLLLAKRRARTKTKEGEAVSA